MDGRLGVFLLIAGMLLSHQSASAAALPKPKHTNKSRFRIPFKFDSTSLERTNAQEVQLHVSRDHGATWELAQKLTPDDGKFEYSAPNDGEYWFSVKTVDARNQVHPPRGSYETGLIVVVDSTAPSLDLSLQQVADGKVQLTWKASDPNLDSKTLQFEYLTPGSQNWEPISIVPRNSGETSWPIDQAGIFAVRGSVSDFAGNIGQTKEQINATVAGGGRAKRARLNGPVAEHQPNDELNSTAKESLSVSVPTVPIPDEQENQENVGPIITPMGKLPQYSQPNEGVNQNRNRWTNAATSVDAAPFSTASLDSSRAVQGPTGVATAESQGFEPISSQRPAQPRRHVARQRLVNTRRFQLGYAVADIGPSGVSTVELFITEDNGRKWWKYGDDPDQKSPVDVEVPRDGVYGFSIRARSGAGLTIGPPLPNELPEQVVAVDQTVPIVELQPIEQGRGANINKLRIRWKITEDHPAEMPVSIEYAASLNGPWVPISGWREDVNHTFDWMVGPNVPTQFYLRVLARDSAGNIGRAETQLPIIVDLVQPTARIVDVEGVQGLSPQ